MPEIRYTGGSRYALRDGPTWTPGDVHTVDGVTADRLADLDKFELVEDDNAEGDEWPEPHTPTPAEQINHGRCPWCDDYEGDHVGQHASSAHPNAWAEYTEGDD